MRPLSVRSSLGVIVLALIALLLFALINAPYRAALLDARDGFLAAVSTSQSSGSGWLSDLLPSKRTTVQNASGKALPKRAEDIPLWQGNKDYSSGSIIAARGYQYGAGAVSSAKAMIAVPPTKEGDAMTVRFAPRYGMAIPRKLSGSLGLASYAPAGTKVNIAVYARPSEDGARTLLYERLLEAGTTYPLLVELPSARRPIIELVITKHGPNNYYQGLVLDGLRVTEGVQVTLEALAPSLTVGKATSLRWRSAGATSCTGTGFPVEQTAGRYIVRPTETTTYSITCTGPGGEASASAAVAVTQSPVKTRLLLGSLLPRQDVVVRNAAGEALPKTYADIPAVAGVKNFSKGSLVPTSAKTSFGKKALAGEASMVATPPMGQGDYATARFPVSGILDQSVSWGLKGTIGLASYAPRGTKTNVAIYASSERGQTLVYEKQVEAGVSYPVNVALSAWQGTQAPALEIVFTKHGANNFNQGLVLSSLSFVPGVKGTDPKPPPPQGGLVHSMARSNLAWESAATQDKVITSLAQFPVGWFRDNIRASALAPTFASLFKRIQAQGKKILVVVTQDAEDYVDPADARAYAGAAFQQKCGWPGGAMKLSKVDLDKFEARLTANLTAFRKERVKIDAFEIGNELDWVCFNGDLPLDRLVGESEYLVHARAYARFLERAVTVINRHYPNALIVSHGAANGVNMNLPGMMVRPGKMIGLMKDLDGVNYHRLIDVVGVHLYPSPQNARSAGAYAVSYASDAGLNKPMWVTEWGFRRSQFTSPSTARYNAFMDMHNSLKASSADVENMFYYALDSFGDGYAVVDGAYAPLPEARFFSDVR